MNESFAELFDTARSYRSCALRRDPGYEIDEIDATQLRKHGFQSL